MSTAQTREVRHPAKSQPEHIKTPFQYCNIFLEIRTGEYNGTTWVTQCTHPLTQMLDPWHSAFDTWVCTGKCSDTSWANSISIIHSTTSRGKYIGAFEGPARAPPGFPHPTHPGNGKETANNVTNSKQNHTLHMCWFWQVVSSGTFWKVPTMNAKNVKTYRQVNLEFRFAHANIFPNPWSTCKKNNYSQQLLNWKSYKKNPSHNGQTISGRLYTSPDDLTQWPSIHAIDRVILMSILFVNAHCLLILQPCACWICPVFVFNATRFWIWTWKHIQQT